MKNFRKKEMEYPTKMRKILYLHGWGTHLASSSTDRFLTVLVLCSQTAQKSSASLQFLQIMWPIRHCIKGGLPRNLHLAHWSSLNMVSAISVLCMYLLSILSAQFNEKWGCLQIFGTHTGTPFQSPKRIYHFYRCRWGIRIEITEVSEVVSIQMSD